MAAKIIVALDAMNQEQALSMASRLKGEVWGFKVNDLLLECGVSIIKDLSAFGGVFADAKIHEIPNTAKNSVDKLSAAGADLITVHASGGVGMLSAAAEASGSAKILAVTLLTSLTELDSNKIYGNDSADTVKRFIEFAVEGGVEGVVCSPQELPLFQEIEGANSLLRVTPGIRPEKYGVADDQARVATPKLASEAGADFLVIGRPITQAEDPEIAARNIVDSIS